MIRGWNLDRIKGSSLGESLVSEAGNEIGSYDGILDGNGDVKLGGLELGESLQPEGGSEIGSYDRISYGNAYGKLK